MVIFLLLVLTIVQRSLHALQLVIVDPVGQEHLEILVNGFQQLGIVVSQQVDKHFFVLCHVFVLQHQEDFVKGFGCFPPDFGFIS